MTVSIAENGQVKYFRRFGFNLPFEHFHVIRADEANGRLTIDNQHQVCCCGGRKDVEEY